VAQPLPDASVERLHQRIPLRGLSVLEAGCYEGHHTASLATFGANVWAFDGRIENVLKTLVRLWVLGLEHAAVVNLVNIEGAPVREQLARLGRTQPFDLIHHRGVLYHLSRPIEHLADLAPLCARHLYLHTHIAQEDAANTTYRSALGEFAALSFGEAERSYAPFAGMTEKALWLTRAGLMSVLSKIGFGAVQVLSEREERHGPRIELIASRLPGG
jgi:tRNA (mo5U34)-methyltransferase